MTPFLREIEPYVRHFAAQRPCGLCKKAIKGIDLTDDPSDTRVVYLFYKCHGDTDRQEIRLYLHHEITDSIRTAIMNYTPFPQRVSFHRWEHSSRVHRPRTFGA